MADLPHKRTKKVLSLAQKVSIIREADKGIKQVELARQYALPPQTVSDILKRKLQLLAAWEKGSTKRKSKKHSEVEKLDEALLKWFTEKAVLSASWLNISHL